MTNFFDLQIERDGKVISNLLIPYGEFIGLAPSKDNPEIHLFSWGKTEGSTQGTFVLGCPYEEIIRRINIGCSIIAVPLMFIEVDKKEETSE